jgi:hypothetical protein
MHPRVASVTVAGLAVCQSLGATETRTPFEVDTVDLTIYWLAPGSDEATFVFVVRFNF